MSAVNKTISVCNQPPNSTQLNSTRLNQSINQSIGKAYTVAELLLGKVRHEKKENKNKQKDGYEKLIVCSV